MTQHQKKKQARHNAEKEGKRRRLTEAEMDRRFSDLRRQEAEANERIQEKVDNINETWTGWTDYYNRYTVPRLCVGFLWALIKIIRKYLVKQAAEAFVDEFCLVMQDVIDKCGDTNCEAFEDYKRDLEEMGFETPIWAQPTEWSETNESN